MKGDGQHFLYFLGDVTTYVTDEEQIATVVDSLTTFLLP